MLSCFMCGRSGSAIEPTTPPKLSPSSQATKLSHLDDVGSITSANAKHGALIQTSAPADSTNSTSSNRTDNIYSSSQDANSESEYPSRASGYDAIQKEVVISTIVARGGHREEQYSRCTTQEADANYISTEDEEICGYDEKICNKVIKDGLMSSTMQDEFSQSKNVDAGNQRFSCNKGMREDDAIPCCCSTVSGKSTCTDTHADVDGELTINAMPNEDDTNPKRTGVNAEKPGSQLYKALDKPKAYGIVPKFVDTGPDASKDIKWNKHRDSPARLFSYGISDQQRDFMFLCAGLVIQAVGFQLKSIVEVVTTIILVGYRVYFFASGVAESLSHIKKRLAEMQTRLISCVVAKDQRESLALHMKNLGTMKPLFIAGAKKMGWGCIKAAYVLALLIALLCISFVFSYFAVKGSSSRQEPIHITQELHFDYTKSHPVASLDLLSLDMYHKSNASKGVKVNPTASIQYRFTMILTLPESDYNRNLGVFQVMSELLSETGDTLLKASQPCMLHFKSNTLHYVRSICLAVPLLAGVTSETQTLSLHLLEWQQDTALPPMSASVLKVVLAPRAGRAISNGLPELYKAEVQVESVYWMPSSRSSSSIRTLVMWIGLSFLLFGLFSSFCMYKMHHNRNSS